MEVNFSKLKDSNQIFRNDFVCINCRICKISTQIIKCIIFTIECYFMANTSYSMVEISDISKQFNFWLFIGPANSRTNETLLQDISEFLRKTYGNTD